MWTSQKSLFCILEVVYLYLHISMFQLYFSSVSGPTFHHGGHQPTIDLSARAYAESPPSIWDNPYISIKMEWPKTHKTGVCRLGMEAVEKAINYVLLTDNGKAGDWKEYKYSIDWLGEGEYGGEKERGTSEVCLAGNTLLWSI